jgi:hypothetical protein
VPGGKFLLLIVFYGFYLADCLVLLLPTQALISIKKPLRPRGRIWGRKARADSDQGGKLDCDRVQSRVIILDFGLIDFPIRGMFLALINPLTPFNPVFKSKPLLPSLAKKSTSKAQPLHRLLFVRLSTNAMSMLLVCHGFLLFGFLPYLLLTGQTVQLLVGLAIAFASAGCVFAFSYAQVRALGLHNSAYWLLGFQSLICLPTSLNFPRKLALHTVSRSTAASLIGRIPARVRPAAARDLTIAIEFAAEGASTPEEEKELECEINRLKVEFPNE